jgi:hypothetical protein
MRGSLFQIAFFIDLTVTQAEKVELPLHLEKTPPPQPCKPIPGSVEVTAIGSNEVLLAAVKTSGYAWWSDAAVTELFSIIHKNILAGDLNANIHFG